MLSKSEIDICEMEDRAAARVGHIVRIPIATSLSISLGCHQCLWITQIRTHRTKVHEEGEGDDPKVRAME